MTIRINTKSKEIFAGDSFAKQNRTISIILMLTVSLILKNSWKMIKTYFSNKRLNSNKIFLSEKERLIKDTVGLATAMNDYFVNIKQTIGLK